MTDHTRTEKIGGDSIVIVFLVVLQVVAGNRYDNDFSGIVNQVLKIFRFQALRKPRFENTGNF